MLINANEVCELAGLPPTTLQGWCERGLVTPVSGGGRGRGHQRRFTLMQALGLVIAARVYLTERSCALSYVGMIVSALMAYPESDLLARLRHSAHWFRFVVGTGGGPFIVWGQEDVTDPECVDVREVYAGLTGQRQPRGAMAAGS